MALHKIVPGKNQFACSISDDGTINLPHGVLATLGWKHRDRIAWHWLESPLLLLFQASQSRENSFQLNYLNKKGTSVTGGKLGSLPFTRDVLRKRVVLPKSGIIPIYPDKRFPLALLLEEPAWIDGDYTKQGILSVTHKKLGAYQLLDADMVIVKIGEGKVIERLDEHLRTNRYPKVVTFQYVELETKEESTLLEDILLTRFRQEHGKLPEYNQIKR